MSAQSTSARRFHERLAARAAARRRRDGHALFSRGIPQRACLDELATTRPDLIGAIHREYLEAGADLIETATFGANRLRLARVRAGGPGATASTGAPPRWPARRATSPAARCSSAGRSGRSARPQPRPGAVDPARRPIAPRAASRSRASSRAASTCS